jgi:hypothetical protein
VMRNTLRDILGSEWSPDIDAAWERLLADIAALAIGD